MPFKKGYIPWNKGKTLSEETKRKLSEAHKGKTFSEEHKRKLSEAHRGQIPWNKGKTLSEETKRKLSEAHKGKTHSEETKRKMSEARKGRYFSKEHRRKISEANKGEKNPFYGKHHSEEHKQKISEALKGKNNPRWRGGLSFLPYSPEFNEQLKREIRERDHHRCQMCGLIGEGSLKKYNRKLCVHHIDGDKQNSDKKNLVTLCASCNTRLELWAVRPQFVV